MLYHRIEKEVIRAQVWSILALRARKNSLHRQEAEIVVAIVIHRQDTELARRPKLVPQEIQ
jgi:hypothetical protein